MSWGWWTPDRIWEHIRTRVVGEGSDELCGPAELARIVAALRLLNDFEIPPPPRPARTCTRSQQSDPAADEGEEDSAGPQTATERTTSRRQRMKKAGFVRLDDWCDPTQREILAEIASYTRGEQPLEQAVMKWQDMQLLMQATADQAIAAAEAQKRDLTAAMTRLQAEKASLTQALSTSETGRSRVEGELNDSRDAFRRLREQYDEALANVAATAKELKQKSESFRAQLGEARNSREAQVGRAVLALNSPAVQLVWLALRFGCGRAARQLMRTE